MTSFPWSYGHHITPTESPSHVLHFIVAAYVFSGWFSAGDPPTLLHTKLLTTPAVTMAAADAPFDHLPMELRPPYHTHRLEITLLQSNTIVVFFLRLVLRRRPTYAITQKPTISRPLWPPPMPHITISHGDMAMILHPERAYRIYYKQQSSNYFSYGWFSAGGPPTTYAPSCEHIPCQLSWPSPMPNKYEHLLMELQPQYCTDREDTSPTSYEYGYTEIFLIRLVLCRRPTYASSY